MSDPLASRRRPARKPLLRAAVAIAALIALSGCYVAPVGYAGYGYGYYHRAPVYAYGPAPYGYYR